MKSPSVLLFRCCLTRAHCARMFIGLYLFFIFFALAMILLLLAIGAAKFYYAGSIPKIILVANAYVAVQFEAWSPVPSYGANRTDGFA